MIRILAILILILMWQGMSSLHVLPTNRFSSPILILSALKDLWEVGLPPGHKLITHIFYSLYRVSIGYIFAVIVALPLGLLMGWIKPLRNIINPLIEVLRHIPPLAWIPISILWFGIGIKSAGFIIFLGAFFPILLNTTTGAIMVDPVYKEVATSLGFKKHHLFLKVLLPASMPYVFTGLRIGMGIAWMTLVAAEFTGIKQGYGLGYMIMVARDIQRVDKIIAGMLTIGTIGIAVDYLFNFARKRMLPWISF